MLKEKIKAASPNQGQNKQKSHCLLFGQASPRLIMSSFSIAAVLVKTRHKDFEEAPHTSRIPLLQQVSEGGGEGSSPACRRIPLIHMQQLC